eukprot:365688-Chlamydomonas_euryale.AAC.15
MASVRRPARQARLHDTGTCQDAVLSGRRPTEQHNLPLTQCSCAPGMYQCLSACSMMSSLGRRRVMPLACSLRVCCRNLHICAGADA